MFCDKGETIWLPDASNERELTFQTDAEGHQDNVWKENVYLLFLEGKAKGFNTSAALMYP